jgi:IS30 family transposase
MGRKKSDQTILSDIVRGKLKTNVSWAVRAMIRIYSENQTSDEQTSQMTVEDNGIGFNGVDGQILSSFSQQVISGRNLSQKQIDIVMKKMYRYTRQVIQFIPEDKKLELLKQ